MGIVTAIELTFNAETNETGMRLSSAFKMLLTNEERALMLDKWQTSLLEQYHRYALLALADKQSKATPTGESDDPEKRSSELQARVQAAEEDRRDEGSDRAPAG